MPTLARASSLNSVTSLTVCRHRSIRLLAEFFLLDSEQGDNPGEGARRRPRRSFAVEPFNRALRDQFPKLENLTLVGNLENHQLVCEQLGQTTGQRLNLALFIEELEDNPLVERSAQTRQTARKSVGGRAFTGRKRR